jgi:hypothetical protein
MQSHQQNVLPATVGPFNAIISILLFTSGPMQSYHENLLLAVMGQFVIIGSVISPILGPYEPIGTISLCKQ